MIYLSRILKSVVQDSADKQVGTMVDFLLRLDNGSYPQVSFLLIKNKKEEIFIPYQYVETLGAPQITLKTTIDKIDKTKPVGDFIYLVRNVLDNQIIDANGARVVRVNDIKLALIQNQLSVVGLDISFKGILRRLGIARFDIFNRFKANLIDWRDAQQVQGVLKLKTIAQKLNRLHPADLANIVENLNLEQSACLISALDTKNSAKVLEEVEPRLQKVIFQQLNKKQAVDILENMSIDELVDLVQALPNFEAKELLSSLHKEKYAKIEPLLSYQADTAGGLMTNEFISAGPHWTVADAIEKIKEISLKFRSILFIYVIDEKGKFLGPISMRSLLIAERAHKLKDLLKPTARLATLQPQSSIEDIINLMTKYDLFSAAVIDKKRRLLGVVTLDDVMRCLAPRA